MTSTSVKLSKVPEVTLTFWVIKILATTLGETGGDALSMTLNWGYALSSIFFIVIFLIAVTAQISAKSFRPFLYWASSCFGRTLGNIRQHRAKIVTRARVITVICAVVMPENAHAGPPFRTDDPVPVELGHHEFCSFSTGTHLKGDTPRGQELVEAQRLVFCVSRGGDPGRNSARSTVGIYKSP